MKLKNKTRLLNELAKEVENPKEFIRGVMALQNQDIDDFYAKSKITPQYFHVIMSQLRTGKQSIGTALCVKISRGLDINPFILNRIIGDYNLKRYLSKLENGTD